jgi:2-isopropylmalate synthase
MCGIVGCIVDNGYQIRPGCAVRTVVSDIEPLVDLQAKHEMQIQASAFLGTSPIRQFAENWTMERIAEETGYADAPTFSKAFKTQTTF